MPVEPLSMNVAPPLVTVAPESAPESTSRVMVTFWPNLTPVADVEPWASVSAVRSVVEKALLVHSAESYEGQLSRGRTRMRELRGADAAIPERK